MSKQLTPSLVAQKAKTEALYSIKSLNLWGNDLDDISLIEKMPNLEVLSLSVNRINTLQDIAKCQHIRELYLRKNNISNMGELEYLQQLPKLKVLWLKENPIAEHPNYKEQVINNSPNLEKLDDIPISQQDRINAQQLAINFSPIKQKIEESYIVDQIKPINQTPQRYSQNSLQNKQDSSRQSYVQQNQYDYQQQHINEQPIQQILPKQQLNMQYASQPTQHTQQQQQQLYMVQQQQQQQQQQQYQQQQLQYQQQQQQIQLQSQQLLQQQQQQQYQIQLQEQRNDNILTAIVSLLKELDLGALKVVQKEVDEHIMHQENE